MRHIFIVAVTLPAFVLSVYTEAWALRPQPAAERPGADDLPRLAMAEARDPARALRAVLDEICFDATNQFLREVPGGSEYEWDPLPNPDSLMNAAAIRKLLIQSFMQAAPENRPLMRRVRYAYEFFVLGMPLLDIQLALVLGNASRYAQQFFDIGLFAETSDGRICMNGLSLVSRQLPNGAVIYAFVDTPPYLCAHMPTERVYIGHDSYLLMDRMAQIPEVDGYSVDMGSGSGIQLMARLRGGHGRERAIGVEIDARARNVSMFNAYLNGVEKRFTVVADADGLAAALGDDPIALAMLNSPFIAMPEYITLDPEWEAVCAGIIPMTRDAAGRPQICLKALYSKIGWGGPGGLTVTKQFMAMLLPHMAPGGQIVIYGQFAGNRDGPDQIMSYIRSMGGYPVFEPSRPSVITLRGQRIFIVSRSEAEQGARIAVETIQQYHPEWRPYQIHLFDVFEYIIQKIRESYAQQGITHFHDGCVVVQMPGVTTCGRTQSGASAADAQV